MYFDSELENAVSENGIVQFYCFVDYIYVRNFSDYGVIGKIENDQVKTLLNLYKLRIAYNGRNTQDNYYGFFLREGKDFYILDETDTEAFTTKDTAITDFDELKNKVYQIKPIADYLN